MSTGSGSLRFRLVNMREDIIMGFFTGGEYIRMTMNSPNVF